MAARKPVQDINVSLCHAPIFPAARCMRIWRRSSPWSEVGDVGGKVSRQSPPPHGSGQIGRAERRPDREDIAAGEVFDTPSPGRTDPKTHRNPGGRPPHRPTETTRRIVENCAAALIPHATIAPLVGVSSVGSRATRPYCPTSRKPFTTAARGTAGSEGLSRSPWRVTSTLASG